MKIVDVDKCEVGSRLARPIHGANGELLLGKGVELTSSYLKRLKRMGVLAIYVEDERLMDVEANDVINYQTRRNAVNVVRKALITACDSKVSNSAVGKVEREIKSIVNSIIDDLTGTQKTIFSVKDLRSYDDYTFSHSVNTCVLALMIGKDLEYNEIRLRNLGVGLLLHDVGKMNIPMAILNKPGKLTDEEYDVIKSHPMEGFRILQSDNEISPVSRAVSVQHHERYDGSGYPKGLKGYDIHEFGRIAAVVDVFDALTSDRVYRRAYMPFQALDEFITEESGDFDPDMVTLFKTHIAAYPVGVGVLLSTGEIGIVIEQNEDSLNLPIVRVVTDAKGNRLEKTADINLSKHQDIKIIKASGL